jgi:hypothetical protein
LPFDEEANAHLLDHLCRRGLEKDLVKPGKTALFQIVLKYMVASGNLIIDRFKEGVPILSRGEGNVHAPHVSEDVKATVATQEADLRVQSTQLSQSQSQPHAQQTSSQLVHTEVRLAKVAFEKATRIAQERSQEEAQEVERKKQEATADSKKTKKAAHYRATMDKLLKLPPCP